MSTPENPLSVRDLEQPSGRLLVYYALLSLVAGPFFPLVLIPLYFKHRSLRYRFDEDGVSMSWGVLFRREVHLTYSRIQDIHLVSNFAERWLGLARIKIQTASGSSKAEMTLEGLHEFSEVRDFLYSRMRGVEDAPRTEESGTASSELAKILSQVASEIRELREAIVVANNPDGQS